MVLDPTMVDNEKHINIGLEDTHSCRCVEHRSYLMVSISPTEVISLIDHCVVKMIRI